MEMPLGQKKIGKFLCEDLARNKRCRKHERDAWMLYVIAHQEDPS